MGFCLVLWGGGINELEAEINTLSDRVKKAKEGLDFIKCEKDADEFGDKHNLDEGFIHIILC